MGSFFSRLYEKMVLDKPYLTLSILALILVVLGSFAHNFKLDASGDSLVLENDDDLRYFRKINKLYSSKDFVIITYTPEGDILSKKSLDGIKALKADLEKLDRVDTVLSIIDVPLLNSPLVKVSELEDGIRTLDTPGLDIELARKEFIESPIYRKLLMSLDGNTTVIQVLYKRDEKYFSLLEHRNDLREKKLASGLSAEEETELSVVSHDYKQYLAHYVETQSKEIQDVRDIIEKHREKAKMFLGGVPMITSDMIAFIRSDIKVFSLGVLFFMVVVLWFFFRSKRWIILPMGCCIIVIIAMVGFLGFMDWRITVISSNFISILLIITISMTIHLIVRYGELYSENPNQDQKILVRETIRHMSKPCFYTAITTIVAFTSLVVSGIRPVIDFGWIMTVGISLTFILGFIFFPALLVLLGPKASVPDQDATKSLTLAIGSITLKHRVKILVGCTVVAIISVVGVLNLQVENRFIDYFKKSTEIYQGMQVIDTKLGGTTPLEIIVEAPDSYFEFVKEMKEQDEEEGFEDDPFAEEESDQEDNYWFHTDLLGEVEKVHDYLESLPEIGKVLSIATTFKVVKLLSEGKTPDDYDMALYRKLLPQNVQESFVHPYLSKDANQIRIVMRIEETDPTLNRGELIEKIRRYMVNEVEIADEQIRFTGMAVLYNNLLHSLYRSQILTLGVVFVAILIMFMILFGNVFIACLAITPNLLSAGFILGLMGWLKIPLDMMTITIAAITIGIAVDDTIHYVHRFQREFPKNKSYKDVLMQCHGSTGRALYYTSITITVGFSILTLSNFIPTIYFGLLTGVAMIIALLNNLTLLPALIYIFRPLGPEDSDKAVPAPA
ncbi:MAG: efflux RND transporter permease subunit [Nitrospinales bacterium]